MIPVGNDNGVPRKGGGFPLQNAEKGDVVDGPSETPVRPVGIRKSAGAASWPPIPSSG
jgi:hypothetical protein